MIKLAFFDIDGTLTKEDGSISQVVIDKIKQVASHGVKIILASGRPTFGMLELAKTFGLEQNDGYIVSYNGCGIYHVPSGKYMSEHLLSSDTIAALDSAVNEYSDISPIYYSNEQIITTRRNEFVDFEAKLNNSVAYVLDSYPMLTPKVIWAASSERLDQIELTARSLFADRCTIARSLPCFLEFTPLGVDKAFALEELCHKLGFSPKETFACGDGGNDKTMIERAGIGVAMANGRDEVKAVADFIAPANSEDGVIVAIDNFLITPRTLSQ